MKKEKSEKQIEAEGLVSKIIRLKPTEVTVHWQRMISNGTMKDEEEVYELCIVNGEKYIRRNSFGWRADNFISMMENHGTISDSDILHFYNMGKTRRYSGGKINVLIKTEIMLKLKDEMMEYIKNENYSVIDAACRAYEAINTSAPISEYTFDEERLMESEAAFNRRKELIRENKEERNKALQEEEVIQPEETLKDLVAKIEAMGWEVTLKMKANSF